MKHALLYILILISLALIAEEGKCEDQYDDSVISILRHMNIECLPIWVEGERWSNVKTVDYAIVCESDLTLIESSTTDIDLSEIYDVPPDDWPGPKTYELFKGQHGAYLGLARVNNDVYCVQYINMPSLGHQVYSECSYNDISYVHSYKSEGYLTGYKRDVIFYLDGATVIFEYDYHGGTSKLREAWIEYSQNIITRLDSYQGPLYGEHKIID